MLSFESVKKLINGSSLNVTIIPHRKPDADALGSCLALNLFLKKKGHHVNVISPTDYPSFLTWMKGNNEVINFENNNKKKPVQKLIESCDLIFCLDFSSLDRIGDLGTLVRDSKAKIILIDHHRGKEDFADYEVWDIEAAATAELLFQFFVDLGEKKLIDKETAECIYAGIMTDTGSFKFPSTSKKTHLIAAEIKAIGVNTSKIHTLVYDNNSENRLKLLGYALNKRLELLKEFHSAFFILTHEDQKKFNAETGDTEGLVNYALSVEGIVLAALFIEKKDHVKISFRSIGSFSVADLAKNYFNGGGHQNAAGGISYDSLNKTVALFKERLEVSKNELSESYLLRTS